jgi:hypothetical protein
MGINIFLNCGYEDGDYRTIPISVQSQWFGVYKLKIQVGTDIRIKNLHKIN